MAMWEGIIDVLSATEFAKPSFGEVLGDLQCLLSLAILVPY